MRETPQGKDRRPEVRRADMRNKLLSCAIIFVALTSIGAAQSGGKKALVPGVKVFIGSMKDDFDTFLKKALEDKKVPISIVPTKDLADVELTGSSDTQK